MKNDQENKYRRVKCFLAAVISISVLTACTGKTGGNPSAGVSVQNPGNEKESTGIIVYGINDYDSEDTAVLVSKDTENKTLTFLNLDIAKRYTLFYDGTTVFADKHGTAISVDMLRIGDITDVRFLKPKKHLTKITLSKDAWTTDETSRYTIDKIKKELSIGDEVYKISSDAVYFTGSEEIKGEDVADVDTLIFEGIGNTVYSVIVSKGHGYLRVAGQEPFVGGWIEVGNKVILKITEDMLLTVPEGTYDIVVSSPVANVTREMTIKRGRESLLDLSDVKIEAPKKGTVLFSISPAGAQLFIDGEEADASAAIELTYGIHQIMCRKEGYRTVTRYITVGQGTAGLDIELEKMEENEKETSTDTSSSTENTQQQTDTTSTTSTSYYKIFVDSPEGVEVYFDGAYVGVAPCSFKKSEGSHVITLSKTGYSTRSYTVTVDGEDRDVTFSFIALEESD